MASYLQFLLVPQKGVANQRPESVLANWTIVPSAQHGKNRLEETDMNTEQLTAASDHEEPLVFATTTSMTPEFSVVIENSSPEYPAKGEAAGRQNSR